MNEHYIRTHDIIRRYIHDQLTEDEQRAFEMYYFEHPEMIKEIELERALRNAVRDSPEICQHDHSGETWVQRVLAWFATPAWALTATAATVVLAAILIVERPSRSTASSPILADVELVRTRGAPAPAAQVYIKGDDGVVAFSIDVAGLDAKSLQARLHDPHGKVTELPLAPDEEFGLARIVIPERALPAGTYELQLDDGSSKQMSYEFEVTR